MSTEYLKVKLVSDGSSLRTFLTDENGKQLGLVESITWRVEAGQPFAELEVKFIGVPVEIDGLLPPADAHYYAPPSEPKPETEGV